jgi:hypothetical protein
MTPPLPSEGPAREIFLRALRHFSNTCEAPSLHHDCPYAVPTSTRGVRGCGEECLNLTAEYGVDATTDRVIDLPDGIGLRLRRPRARRDPPATVKPFDAREIYLQDKSKPIGETWRITSILMAVLDQLCKPPTVREPDSEPTIRQLMDELAKRGVDVDRAVRYGMSRAIARNIFSHVLIPVMVAKADPNRELPERYRSVLDDPTLDRWGRLLYQDDQSTRTRLAAVADIEPRPRFEQFKTTWSWAATTDLPSLIAWTPPNDYEFSLLSTSPAPTDDVQQWLVDRFTQTYPDVWTEASRELEYRYLLGEQVPPCDTSDMQSRRIVKAELYEAIADSHVRGTSRPGAGFLSADTYVGTAVDMLQAGRRAGAAAVFEAQRIVAPSDPRAHNNYGFCLLMDDPARALHALEQAANMGLRWWDVNVANRMLGMTMLGRSTSALELATQFWINRGEKVRTVNAYLWDFESLEGDASPVLLSDTDPHVYVARLAAQIASSAGDDHLAGSWSEKASQANDELGSR